MQLHDYFKAREYPIEKIWFTHDGSRHEGQGVMTWVPEAGFHIAAKVIRIKPYPEIKEIKAFSINPPVTLKMNLEYGLRAFAQLTNIDELNLSRGWVSADFDCTIFIQHTTTDLIKNNWYGTALYEQSTNLLLPDTVSTDVRVGGGEPILRYSKSGIRATETSGQHVTAYARDDKLFEVHWSLPKSSWTKEQNWDFAKGFQDAISITTGDAMQLLQHESYRENRIFTEVRLKSKPTQLGPLLKLMENTFPERDTIIVLANFLSTETKESFICRKILRQVTAAAQINLFEAKQLLLARILEAALRTLYNQPFEENRNNRTDRFSLVGCLKKFQETYMVSPEDVEMGRRWKRVREKVIETQRRLRDRNAHPDWLSIQDGSYSEDIHKQALNDMMFLSRFYGYMILSLAGLRNIQPVFPAAFDDWPSMITISRFPLN